MVRKKARRAGVAVVGGATVALGIVLIPLPGPGTLVTAGGLAILATEFDWARRRLDQVKDRVRRLTTGRPEDDQG